MSEKWLDGQTDRDYLSSTYLLPRHAAHCAALHYLHDTALPCRAQHCTALHITLDCTAHYTALSCPTLHCTRLYSAKLWLTVYAVLC